MILDKNGNKVEDKIKNGILREKLLNNENVENAVLRAIGEELGEKYILNIRGIDGKGNKPIPYDGRTGKICDDIRNCMYSMEIESISYPGLQMLNTYYPYAVIIPDLSNEHGYRIFETIEYKEDGSIKRYIEWIWNKRFTV